MNLDRLTLTLTSQRSAEIQDSQLLRLSSRTWKSLPSFPPALFVRVVYPLDPREKTALGGAPTPTEDLTPS